MHENLIFAGTPDFAARHLQALIDDGRTPTLVLTQPDRAAGRGRKLKPSPVKVIAEQYNIPVYQPEKLDDEARQELESLSRPDLLIVVAYGLLLPQWALDWGRFGAINVHASLLPRWRGAAPIQRAIEAGDVESGVGIMQMDKGLDTGDIWKEIRVPIADTMNAQQLHDELQNVGVQALLEVLPAIFSGTTAPVPQLKEDVCYAKKLSKQEAHICWDEPAEVICRKIRAFNPVPIAYSETESGQRFRFYQATPLNVQCEQVSGSVVSEDKTGIVIACQDGAVSVEELQETGKKRLSAENFLNGKSLLGETFI